MTVGLISQRYVGRHHPPCGCREGKVHAVPAHAMARSSLAQGLCKCSTGYQDPLDSVGQVALRLRAREPQSCS